MPELRPPMVEDVAVPLDTDVPVQAGQDGLGMTV